MSRELADIAKHAVRRQMNQGGNILLCGLEPLDEDEFFAAGCNGVSPAWTVGHLACVLDLFTSWVIRRPLVFESTVHDVFNPLDIRKQTMSKADTVDRRRFTKPDLLLWFRQAQVRTLAVLRDFDMRLWNAATEDYVPDTLPSYGAIWQNLGVHTFWHLGELSASVSRFHGTYTLNTVAHYFYTQEDSATFRVAEAHPLPDDRVADAFRRESA
jgi:hypothetical protein